MKLRFKNISNFKIYFWKWEIPFGSCSFYIDKKWLHQANFGIICFCWNTPVLNGDF